MGAREREEELAENLGVQAGGRNSRGLGLCAAGHVSQTGL